METSEKQHNLFFICYWEVPIQSILWSYENSLANSDGIWHSENFLSLFSKHILSPGPSSSSLSQRTILRNFPHWMAAAERQTTNFHSDGLSLPGISRTVMCRQVQTGSLYKIHWSKFLPVFFSNRVPLKVHRFLESHRIKSFFNMKIFELTHFMKLCELYF